MYHSSYRYWQTSVHKLGAKRAIKRSLVSKVWQASGNSVEAKNIAVMATNQDIKLGGWLAGKLTKELGLSSCQPHSHQYQRGSHQNLNIPNVLARQLAVTQPNQVWCGAGRKNTF